MNHIIIKEQKIVVDGVLRKKKSVEREMKDTPYVTACEQLSKVQKVNQDKGVVFEIHSFGNEKDLRAFKASIESK